MVLKMPYALNAIHVKMTVRNTREYKKYITWTVYMNESGALFRFLLIHKYDIQFTYLLHGTESFLRI